MVVIPERAIPRDVKYKDEPVKYMRWARLDSEKKDHPKSEFSGLWPGHWGKVVEKQAIFLQVGGNGGSHKFLYKTSRECHGYEMLIYKHCHDKLKEVGIIVMKARPTLVVSSEVVRSSDVPVTCIVWRYCATNNVAHVKCYFDHAS